MNKPLTQKFSLGSIVVDPASNTLYLKGVEKRLEPKLIALLCLFAAQGRQVISRQEITETIWPNVVVGEESVARTVFALRNALGDDAKQPQFIETIPKKGYRFLVDAQLIDDTGVVLHGMPRVKKQRIILLTAAITLFALVGVWWWGGNTKPSIEIESLVPVNKMEGVERDIKLSADGKHLLFVHDAGKTFDIYSRELTATTDVLWVHQDQPLWSPLWIDKNSIAYIRKDQNNFQIVRHYKGQPIQILYQSSKPLLQLSQTEKDLDNIFFLELQHNDLIELKSLNLRSGEQQNWRDFIPDLPKKIHQLQNAKLANSLLIIKDNAGKPEIVSLDLESKRIERVSNQFGKINKVSAVNKTALLVTGNIGGSQGIWLLQGKEKPTLILRASGSEEIVDVQIDEQEKTIFYSNLQENTDVRLLWLHGNAVQELVELNSNGIEAKAVAVEKGKFIYFVSNRTGFFEVWRYEAESKKLKQVSTLNALSITWFSLSHNNQMLAIGYQADQLYLSILDVETGKSRVRTQTPSHRFPLAWSFDDKTIYVSEHEAQVNLFTYDTATLTAQLFAPQAGLYVKALDDQRVIYFDYSRHGLIERELLSQQEKTLRDNFLDINTMLPGMLKLNQQNNQLYASCGLEWRNQICSYSLSSPENPPVAVKDISYSLFASDIAEDGETVLATEFKPSSGDIMKMQLSH